MNVIASEIIVTSYSLISHRIEGMADVRTFEVELMINNYNIYRNLSSKSVQIY
jgi:hypothetical protein